MSSKPFLGTGPNPEDGVPDLPLGFGMQLAQNTDAMNFFASLTPREKTKVIEYTQSGQTGNEAKERVLQAIEGLNRHETTF